MPRQTKSARVFVRIDREFQEALDALQDLYPDVSKSELIRRAVLEKSLRDTKRHRPPKTGD